MVVIHAGRAARSDRRERLRDHRGAIVDIANRARLPISTSSCPATATRPYVCTFGTKLVTSAQSNGALLTDIDLRIDRATGEVVSKTARNVIVARDIAKSAAMTALLDHYRPFLAELGQRPSRNDLRAASSKPRTTPASRRSATSSRTRCWSRRRRPRPEERRSRSGIPEGSAPIWSGSPPTPQGAPITVTFAHAFDVLPFGQPRRGPHRDRRRPGRRCSRPAFPGFARRVVSGRSHRVLAGSESIARRSRSVGRPIDPARPDPRRHVRTSSGTAAMVWWSRAATRTTPAPTSTCLSRYLEKRSPIRPGPQDRITRKIAAGCRPGRPGR